MVYGDKIHVNTVLTGTLLAVLKKGNDCEKGIKKKLNTLITNIICSLLYTATVSESDLLIKHFIIQLLHNIQCPTR